MQTLLFKKDLQISNLELSYEIDAPLPLGFNETQVSFFGIFPLNLSP
jgi:hypothetical protein